MAEVLFEIPEWLDYADYDNYPSESKPTTNADFINYSRNQNKLVGALTSAFLWQPNTNFIAGKIIITPNMPEGMEAVALTGGFTGTVEPAWERDIAEYQDSGVKWQLRYQHWSKENATNRLPNTSYAVGNVVYDKSNLSVALKCTTAGITSNTELDISNRAVGDSVDDGSVVWEIVSRDVVNIIDAQRPIKTFTSLAQLGLGYDCTPQDIANAMPNDSVLQVGIINNDESNKNPNLGIENMAGFLTVKKDIGNGSVSFYFHAYYNYGDYIAGLSSGVFTGWRKLATNGALSMPSNNAINISLASHFSTYTAPADGWISVYFSITSQTSENYLGIYRQQDGFGDIVQYPIVADGYKKIFPVKKGDIVVLSFSGITITNALFVYAQSEV